MKIAIIGGGTAGMVCAHYLCRNHNVTVFEKASFLGGNIRTLNGNVHCNAIPQNVRIEAGATAFNFVSSPTIRRLYKELKVPFYLSAPKLASSMSLSSRQRYIVPSFHTWKQHGPKYFFKTCKVHKKLFPDMIKMFWRLTFLSEQKLRAMPMAHLIHGASPLAQYWMRCSIMLGLSMSYDETAYFPANWIRSIFFKYRIPMWATPQYGMYHFIERILELSSNRLTVFCDAHIKAIKRDESISISLEDGATASFDKIIFACPPFEILGLLSDATEEEKKRFSIWQSRELHTTSHSDLSMYQCYAKPSPSPFDYFEINQGEFAYNTYLNDIYRIPGNIPYSFSYNLDDQLDPDKILTKTHYKVPVFNNKTTKYNQEILATNGENNTFFIGAYLGHGLQESATKTAKNVSDILI